MKLYQLISVNNNDNKKKEANTKNMKLFPPQNLIWGDCLFLILHKIVEVVGYFVVAVFSWTTDSVLVFSFSVGFHLE